MGRRAEQQLVATDEQIIDMYWQRDEIAIQETDKKYGKTLFRIAYNILNDRLDCNECQNDTYLGIWNSIPPIRPLVFSAFAVQIMRRVAINRYKEKTRKKRVPSELTVSMEELNNTLHNGNSVEVAYEAKEIGNIINRYIKTLSARRRYIFIERFYFAETVETIASALSISQPSVYREIEKIKSGLKVYLERNDIYI